MKRNLSKCKDRAGHSPDLASYHHPCYYSKILQAVHFFRLLPRQQPAFPVIDGHNGNNGTIGYLYPLVGRPGMLECLFQELHYVLISYDICVILVIMAE